MTYLEIHCYSVPMFTVNFNRLRLNVSQIVLDHQFTIASFDFGHIVNVQESILRRHQ